MCICVILICRLNLTLLCSKEQEQNRLIIWDVEAIRA